MTYWLWLRSMLDGLSFTKVAAELKMKTGINISSPEARKIRENWVSVMAVDVLAPSVARPSAAMTLTVWDKSVIVLHEEVCQLPSPARCREMKVWISTILCFLRGKIAQHQTITSAAVLSPLLSIRNIRDKSANTWPPNKDNQSHCKSVVSEHPNARLQQKDKFISMSHSIKLAHDDVMIHHEVIVCTLYGTRSAILALCKGLWIPPQRVGFDIFFFLAWIHKLLKNCCTNSRTAGDSKRHDAHVTLLYCVMLCFVCCSFTISSQHYSDVIMRAMASKSPAFRLFAKPFVQAQINFVRGLHRWPMIPLTTPSNAENISVIMWWQFHHRIKYLIIDGVFHHFPLGETTCAMGSLDVACVCSCYAFWLLICYWHVFEIIRTHNNYKHATSKWLHIQIS